jgi:hypothetical protein
MERFWNEQGIWSEETFGPSEIRGPIGPLKHLRKEVEEALEAKTPVAMQEEIVDCLFLVFDAARRAGFSLQFLEERAMRKLAKNKLRTWPAWDWQRADEPVEHQR